MTASGCGSWWSTASSSASTPPAFPSAVRGRIDRVVEPLVGQRNLKLGEIERRLLIAGDTYGVALRLGPSPAPNRAARSSRSRRTSIPSPARSGSTTPSSDQLGTWTLATGVEINSAFKLGETIYFRASGYPGGDGEAASAASSPAIRAPAPSRWARSSRSARTGSPSTSRRPAARRRPSPTDGIQTRTEFQRLVLPRLLPGDPLADVER